MMIMDGHIHQNSKGFPEKCINLDGDTGEAENPSVRVKVWAIARGLG